MRCPTHGVEMTVVCDVESCGLCYEETMERERVVAPYAAPMEYVYDPDKHMMVERKKRGER